MRRFTDKPVEEDAIVRLTLSGLKAANAHNVTVCKFMVITDKPAMEAVLDMNFKRELYEGATTLIIPLYELGKLYLYKQDRSWESGMYACSENIILGLEDEGLDGIWLGVYPYMEKVELLQDILQLPLNTIPFSVIALGYPAKEQI